VGRDRTTAGSNPLLLTTAPGGVAREGRSKVVYRGVVLPQERGRGNGLNPVSVVIRSKKRGESKFFTEQQVLILYVRFSRSSIVRPLGSQQKMAEGRARQKAGPYGAARMPDPLTEAGG